MIQYVRPEHVREWSGDLTKAFERMLVKEATYTDTEPTELPANSIFHLLALHE